MPKIEHTTAALMDHEKVLEALAESLYRAGKACALTPEQYAEYDTILTEAQQSKRMALVIENGMVTRGEVCPNQEEAEKLLEEWKEE